MASGRRGAGERVLEGKHVIGLFLLMLLFSGIFFALGYKMGLSQYAGEVRAESTGPRTGEPAYIPKSQAPPRKAIEPPAGESITDPAMKSDKAGSGGWDFSHTTSPAPSEPHLDPAPKPSPATSSSPKTVNARAKVDPAPSAPVKAAKASSSNPLIPAGSLLLQVAALKSRDDALAVASSLQKKHFAAFVQTPQKDNFYRVQVGPFKDQKTADATKKGLEGAGYKAFYVKH